MRLIQLRVSPVNCQVALLVPDAEESPPDWPTGRELVVGNAAAIYVGTICDVDGEVTVEVWQAEELPQPQPQPHHAPIYDGFLQVRNAGALVGSVTGNHPAYLALLTEGAHRVRVYTRAPSGHPEWADYVAFVLD